MPSLSFAFRLRSHRFLCLSQLLHAKPLLFGAGLVSAFASLFHATLFLCCSDPCNANAHPIIAVHFHSLSTQCISIAYPCRFRLCHCATKQFHSFAQQIYPLQRQCVSLPILAMPMQCVPKQSYAVASLTASSQAPWQSVWPLCRSVSPRT